MMSKAASAISLFQRLLGDEFQALAPSVRVMHGAGRHGASGCAEIFRTAHPIGALIARAMGLPPTASAVPIVVDFLPTASGERWRRRFGRHRLESSLVARDGLLVERLGPAAFSFRLARHGGGLRWEFQRLTVLGLPWPRWLSPQVHALESEADGRYRFAVTVALPWIGSLVRYHGSLQPREEPDMDPVVVFDGVCNLCNRWVNFLLVHDLDRVFKFAAIQSRTGAALLRAHGESPVDPQTLLLIEEGVCYKQTAAILRIARALRWHWRLLAALARLVPGPLRDGLYNVVARNRYRVFGKRDACTAPAPEAIDRFLP